MKEVCATCRHASQDHVDAGLLGVRCHADDSCDDVCDCERFEPMPDLVLGTASD